MSEGKLGCRKRGGLAVAMGLILIGGGWLIAQFTNRYPKVEGYRHHIYLEGYELPILGIGPTDPAPSPQEDRLVFASRGWLWSFDLQQRAARRITFQAGIDARPAFSPDGRRVAFVRDDTRDTSILELDLETGQERILVATPALDLDPVYSAGGDRLFFSSASAGDLDLWELELDSGATRRLTNHSGLELKPQPVAGSNRLIYVQKTRGGRDQVRLLNLDDGQDRTLSTHAIASQMRPALDPTGNKLALGLPEAIGWRLWLQDWRDPEFLVRLQEEAGLPLFPAWGRHGDFVYFTEADSKQKFRLARVPASGGRVEPLEVLSWDWGEPLASLVIRTQTDGRPVPARIEVLDERGHPLLPDQGQVRFDSQNGKTYFYSPGLVEIQAPPGKVSITAARGLTHSPAEATAALDFDTRSVQLELAPLDLPSGDWYSGDHHFHLNYGGPYRLHPAHLLPEMAGEDLDVATPLLANLHNRFEDVQWKDWRHYDPIIRFGQEIRAHFLGHLGLVGTQDLFWPWYWGPGYMVFSGDDRPNTEVLQWVRDRGGISAYVHPVSRSDPFPDHLSSIPLEVVADAVLGELDSLEVACLWSDEIGTSQLWYRFLNLGIAIAPSAGTDAFPNFYRSMAIGSTRVYVRLAGSLTWHSYLDGLKAGRSFVTSGPLIDFVLDGKRPGEVGEGGKVVSWQATVSSPTAFDWIELIHNGQIVWRDKGLTKAGSKRISGAAGLSPNGWVALRAWGGETQWPVMDSYPFAHTAPIWLGSRGSFDAEAAAAAARDLRQVLDQAEHRLDQGYSTPVPRLRAVIERARRQLDAFEIG